MCIPAVTFSAALPSLSVATFTPTAQTNLKNAILSKATGATAVSLIQWYDGSLVVESAVDFPSTESTSASSFTTLLKSSTGIASVFPASTYGVATVQNVTLTSKYSTIRLVASLAPRSNVLCS